MSTKGGSSFMILAVTLACYSIAIAQGGPPPKPPQPTPPDGRLCCWVFVPTQPKEIQPAGTFEGRVIEVDAPRATVQVEIQPYRQVYRIKEVAGYQTQLLHELKKGEAIKATFVEQTKMYYLERVEKPKE